MLTRRDFGLGLGLGLGAWVAVPAFAQGVKVLKVANTAGVMDAQQCFITCGQHPKLNFYKQEGVDVEYVNMTSIVQALQSLMTNQVHFGPMAPGILLPALAKEPTLDLVAVYEWLPRNANVICVKPGSPIKSAADLAGKKIGVRNQGDPGIVVTKTMLAELGLKDDKCEFIAIGDGLVQQLLGAGVAARLSAKLGEGVVNGMLTARVGLSAMTVCRPMGFDALPAPTLSDVAGSLIKPGQAI